MKTEEIACRNCNKTTQKESKELNRQRKNGRSKFYCSQSCAAVASNRDTPRTPVHPFRGNIDGGRHLDQHSPFRWFLARIRYRDKNHNTRGRKGWVKSDLTLDYLLGLWKAQDGVCPFTGWKMVLPEGTEGWNGEETRYRASLDRVDCSLGYIQQNVRFVSVQANFARHTFTDQELRDFCNSVSTNSRFAIP